MAMTNIVRKKTMQYFPEIQVFVVYEVGFFFALQFNFSVKRKIEEKQTVFFQFIYLGIDHDHL